MYLKVSNRLIQYLSSQFARDIGATSPSTEEILPQGSPEVGDQDLQHPT